jgi:aryl-phospho-beta-D-glucosidase BglC (GH1 family)
MKTSRREFAWAALAAATAVPAQESNRFVRAKGKDLVTPDGRKLLLRGINLGNWLEPEGYMFLFEKGPESPHEIEAFVDELIGPDAADEFWTAYRQRYITSKDIEFVRACGFNSVRVPLHWKFFTDDAGFRLLDPALAACRTAGLWVILDMHCAPGGQTGTNIDDSEGYPWLYDGPKQQELLITIWKRIAQRYRDEPIILGYDLLNEPIPHFPKLQKFNSKLESLYKRVTQAIRAVDTNHVIILGGAQWDSNFAVFGTPFDNNLMYQFHKYWVAPVQEQIKDYVDFRDRYNVPIWLGESGENTDDWVRQFVQLLEKNDIGWCFWPYKKMEKSSCVVSIVKPEHWNEIVALSEQPAGTGNAEKRIASRPSDEICRAALDGLLSNIELQKCRVNRGYIEALGLRAPTV